MPRSSHGFTLIELITVMVIAGILAATSVGLIRWPVNAYMNLQRRATMTDNTASALSMMQRDIRRALPNSIRINNSGTALELLHTTDGGRYRAFPASDGSGDMLDFTTSDSSFDVMGSLSTAPTGSVVIYNLGNTTADAYSGNNLATLSNTSTTILIKLASAKQFPLPSPQQRFFIVDTPISYGCDTAAGNLLRYSGYAITAAQVYPPADVTGQIQANTVSSCMFTYTAGSATRNGLVTLQITLTSGGGSGQESSTLIHQVHVDNAP